ATGAPLRGLWIDDIGPDTPGKRTYLETRLFGRVLADPVTMGDGSVIEAGTMITELMMDAMRDDPAVTRARCLSPLTDDSQFGISAKSYGMSLATGKPIEEGEAVGVIAAQSIGEPGTQLTMRTFHTGGIAGSDIAGGLPRVVELFEARSPKGKAILARTTGVIRIAEDEGKGRVITVVDDEGGEESYTVPLASRLSVVDGDQVTAGDVLIGDAKTPKDPKELLEIKGVRETQQYLVGEVQKVYRDQGVSIHDKHIELIVRQMTKRIAVSEAGDAVFLPGERVDSRIFQEVNKVLREEGKVPAEGRPELMGITKASLATDSWLSAASFQETTRVLTEAAIESRSDNLLGLKENIIIGKLIPAGTGMPRYRAVATDAPEYEPMAFYSSEDDDAHLSDWLASRSDFSAPVPAPAPVPVPADG
ncbi:MAG: DNA-directed RNA polymerase subunit beta', partial [Actinomycetota bacterium]|nr:DNA-directed RNA polymerase subunit beta' [Actinomycetota bacterium]